MDVLVLVAVLSREENHDVVVAASIGDACRNECGVEEEM
jgi:hypothetical protein